MWRFIKLHLRYELPLSQSVMKIHDGVVVLRMNIIVCVKHVVDTTEIRLDKKTGELILRGIPTKINDYDRNAVQEAVRLKKETGGQISLVCVGPREAAKTLKEALAMGADKAYLVSAPAFAYVDPQFIAGVLSAAIAKIGDYDLVLCGDVSEDGYNSQVGPGIAQRLGLSHVSYAISINYEAVPGTLIIERALKDEIELIRAKTPLLLGLNSRINIPRLPTTIQVMKVPSNRITEWKMSDLGVEAEENKVPTYMRGYKVPVSKRKRVLLEGSSSEIVDKLIGCLKEEGVV